MTAAAADQWAIQGVPNSILLAKPFAPAQLVTVIFKSAQSWATSRLRQRHNPALYGIKTISRLAPRTMENRKASRHRVFKAGTIEFGRSAFTCVVRDRSDVGAKLDAPV